VIEWENVAPNGYVGRVGVIELFMIGPTRYRGLEVTAFGLSTRLPGMADRIGRNGFASVEKAKAAAEKELDGFLQIMNQGRDTG
jgi:hypothetical protein